MDKRIKKLWVKALRSGNYEQGICEMKTPNSVNPKYCCLGVLERVRCDITGGKFRNTGILAPVTRKWAGLSSGDPIIAPRAKLKTASSINDSGKDFNYIADRIEKYL